MLKRARTIGMEVTALVIFTLILSLAFSFVVFVAAPRAAHRLIEADFLIDALAAPGHRSNAVSLEISKAPPGGRTSPLLINTIARRLAVPASDIQAVWAANDTAIRLGGASEGKFVMVIVGTEVVVEETAGGFVLLSSGQLRLQRGTLTPEFIAAVRQADGRWLTARPRLPLLGQPQLRILGALAVFAIVVGAANWRLARRLTAPVRGLADAASALSLNTDAPNAPESGPNEIRAAAYALNAMARRLRNESDERIRLFAAVAHDLRTPITSMRVRAESAPPDLKAKLVGDLDRMRDMIADLLAYTASVRPSMRRSAVHIETLVKTIATDAELPPAAVHFSPDATPAIVLGDERALYRAIMNIVQNGQRYAKNVQIEIHANDRTMTLAVTDDGPGIPAEHTDRVQAPFERLDVSRSADTGGLGLGLSIAREILSAHGGTMTLANTCSGLGVQIELPLRLG